MSKKLLSLRPGPNSSYIDLSIVLFQARKNCLRDSSPTILKSRGLAERGESGDSFVPSISQNIILCKKPNEGGRVEKKESYRDHLMYAKPNRAADCQERVFGEPLYCQVND